MKLLLLVLAVFSFSTFAADKVPSSVECIKKELVKTKSMEKAYQACSVKK
ncbi:hypothetical protein [Bacteriovorax sp. Seq25_V]|nr:hypothetical protein [Bacteriovorax sp. Seq25_V]EQC45402.1 hypothetical protein M900_2171 [Bacteriovorax sp. Seq25_V]